MMKESNIDDLYDRFNRNGVTSDILWDLSDEILKDDVKLTRIELLRYQKAKDKAKC